MNNNNTDLGREEILTLPPTPIENALPDFDPNIKSDFLTVEDSSDLLEDLIVRVYTRTLADPNIATSDSLRAAKDAATMIGKAGGTQKVTIVKAENAQINQLNENPELLEHLKRAALGLTDLSHATEADVIVARGGQGA